MTKGKRSRCTPSATTGATYIISTDESGGQAGVGGLAAACARGASPYGYPNIIDITDERNPKIVSKLMLEVNDPANCELFLNEPPEVGGGLLDYSNERCVADRPDESDDARLRVSEMQACEFSTFAISSILKRSRTGSRRLCGRLSFPDQVAGHRASIEPSIR